jgi:uncharacterized damage-inducible protein DinB
MELLDHVLGIVADLSDDDLSRPVLPSGWTVAGLVNHLALDVELFWFGAVIGGEQAAIDELAAMADAWQVDPQVPAREILDRYRQEIERANAVITATPEDAPPAWWPGDLFGSWRLRNHRAVLLHVIAETACHAGHLDAARELIDGRQWLVLT